MADGEAISELIILEDKPAASKAAALKGLRKDRRLPAARGLKEVVGDLSRDRKVVGDFSKQLDELQAKARPGPLLDYQHGLQRAIDRGILIKHHLGPGQTLRLSPRANHVEGHGHLNFINVRHLFGENDQAWFYSDDDQPDDARKVEIWLRGLTVGASYLVQIRVSGHAGGQWQVRGSDTTGVFTVAGGFERTIPVLVHEVDLDMSLVTINATGMNLWGFYDATISAL